MREEYWRRFEEALIGVDENPDSTSATGGREAQPFAGNRAIEVLELGNAALVEEESSVPVGLQPRWEPEG